MAQKKINGYTIYMEKLLGKGSYGAVCIYLLIGLSWIEIRYIISCRSKNSRKEKQ